MNSNDLSLTTLLGLTSIMARFPVISLSMIERPQYHSLIFDGSIKE